MNQEEGAKEKKIWTRVKYDARGVQDEWENEAQTIDKNIKKMLKSIKYMLYVLNGSKKT